MDSRQLVIIATIFASILVDSDAKNSTALSPIEFCKAIGQQAFPLKPVKQESDESGTSSSQNTGR